MRGWTEEEYEKEAKRLGWNVEYLKAHLRKEERIQKVFKCACCELTCQI